MSLCSLFAARAIRYHADPVLFAEETLAFSPDPTQALLLRSRARKVLLNCSRQWGKSTVTAASAGSFGAQRATQPSATTLRSLHGLSPLNADRTPLC